MKRPEETNYRYPVTGNQTAVDEAEYNGELNEYIDYLESKLKSDLLHNVSNPFFPDHYRMDLNIKRIKEYRFEAEKYRIDEDTVGKIFSSGADWYRREAKKLNDC